MEGYHAVPEPSDHMMPEQNRGVDPSTPLSWRDVYRAVAESEVRIVAAINSAVSPLNASVIDHESRLRDIERHGTSAVQGMSAKLDSMYLRIEALERDDVALMAREKGILATLSGAQKTVLLMSAGGGLLWVIVQIVDKALL